MILTIIVNIVSSLLFLFIILLLLRPKIKISYFICKNEGYQIKVINKSFFSAFDIKTELAINTKKIDSDGSTSNRYIPAQLVVKEIFKLPPYKPFGNKKSTPNAVRFRTMENLNEIIADSNKSILFMITARHGLTGITSVFSKEFFQLSEIVEGNFTNGNSFSYISSKE